MQSYVSHPPTQHQANAYQCLVASVDYNGGIIGAFTDRRAKLQTTIQNYNSQGYRLRQVLSAKTTIGSVIVQLLCLTITLLLWAPEREETLIFERNA